MQEVRIRTVIPNAKGVNEERTIVLLWAIEKNGVLHEVYRTGEHKIDHETKQPITWPGATVLSFYRTKNT